MKRLLIVLALMLIVVSPVMAVGYCAAPYVNTSIASYTNGGLGYCTGQTIGLDMNLDTFSPFGMSGYWSNGDQTVAYSGWVEDSSDVNDFIIPMPAGVPPGQYAHSAFYNRSDNCIMYSQSYLKNASNCTAPPIADFTGEPASGAAPLYVLFNDTSTNDAGICTYTWTIEPASGVSAGATGTMENHAASFSVPGSYNVSHGVSCAAGSDFENKTDYITVYNATTDYITTHFVVMDEPRWSQLAGSTINMLDIENGTWKNVSPSTAGYEGITTLSNHTISAFASMTGYSDDELIAQPAWSGGDYRLLLFPTGYGNVSAGNVTVYVSVYDSDVLANQGRVADAAVNMAYSSGGDQVNDYRTTDAAGMVSFVVPNNTVIYLYAEKAGYTRGGTTINSGTGSGGSAAVYAEITLARTTVTTAPTVTTLPGGGTPAPTVDPYPCDADHPENCKRKQTDMANSLIEWGPDLLMLFIFATIIGVFKMIAK